MKIAADNTMMIQPMKIIIPIPAPIILLTYHNKAKMSEIIALELLFTLLMSEKDDKRKTNNKNKINVPAIEPKIDNRTMFFFGQWCLMP